MEVSWNRGIHGYPQIIHFNGIFHYKPSILEYPHSRNHPYCRTMLHWTLSPVARWLHTELVLWWILSGYHGISGTLMYIIVCCSCRCTLLRIRFWGPGHDHGVRFLLGSSLYLFGQKFDPAAVLGGAAQGPVVGDLHQQSSRQMRQSQAFSPLGLGLIDGLSISLLGLCLPGLCEHSFCLRQLVFQCISGLDVWKATKRNCFSSSQSYSLAIFATESSIHCQCSPCCGPSPFRRLRCFHRSAPADSSPFLKPRAKQHGHPGRLDQIMKAVVCFCSCILVGPNKLKVILIGAVAGPNENRFLWYRRDGP